MTKKFYRSGIAFECQGSGRCCVSRGGYGFVYLSAKDRKRMAAELGIPTRQFTRTYCTKTNGWFHLKDMKGDCVFLQDKKCTVYEGRPAQCRTWPFWPENMNAKVWNTEVAKFCPGVGKGRVYSAQEIEKQLAADSWKG